MAQTIAVQRGSTTVAGDGTTKTTLFTQSSGTATRVILVGASANTSGGTGINMAFGLQINVNASGAYLPVALIKGNGQAIRYLNMFPAASTTGNSSFFGATAGTLEQIMTSTPTIGSTTDGGFGANVAGSGQIQLAANVVPTFSQTPINYVPAQFWMASGDVLVASVYISSGLTATIIYHFVTITES